MTEFGGLAKGVIGFRARHQRHTIEVAAVP